MRFFCRLILSLSLIFSICNICAQEVQTIKLSESISSEFDQFTKTLEKFLSYEIPLYEGSVEISENKVINFEDIAQKIKLQDEKIYKYLNDLFLEDNHAKELLDNYNYESIPSEELISLVVKKFPIDFEGVHFNNYFFEIIFNQITF